MFSYTPMAVQVWEPRAGMGWALFLLWNDWLPLCGTWGILWPTLPFGWSYFLHIRRIKPMAGLRMSLLWLFSLFLLPLSLSILHQIWWGAGEGGMEGSVCFLKKKKTLAVRKMGVKCCFKTLLFCQPSCNVTNIAPRDDPRLQWNWSIALTISSHA